MIYHQMAQMKVINILNKGNSLMMKFKQYHINGDKINV